MGAGHGMPYRLELGLDAVAHDEVGSWQDEGNADQAAPHAVRVLHVPNLLKGLERHAVGTASRCVRAC